MLLTLSCPSASGKSKGPEPRLHGPGGMRTLDAGAPEGSWVSLHMSRVSHSQTTVITYLCLYLFHFQNLCLVSFVLFQTEELPDAPHCGPMKVSAALSPLTWTPTPEIRDAESAARRRFGQRPCSAPGLRSQTASGSVHKNESH